jgi:hypothetical protein
MEEVTQDAVGLPCRPLGSSSGKISRRGERTTRINVACAAAIVRRGNWDYPLAVLEILPYMNSQSVQGRGVFESI